MSRFFNALKDFNIRLLYTCNLIGKKGWYKSQFETKNIIFQVQKLIFVKKAKHAHAHNQLLKNGIKVFFSEISDGKKCNLNEIQEMCNLNAMQ